MPRVNITTRDTDGPTPFTVDQDTIDRCVEQLNDPNAVLVLREDEGTGYIPVRHVVGLYVVA